MEDYKKKYEEALKKVYELHRNWPCVSGLIDVREELEEIFPELKESNDELIIKDIISYLKYKHSDPDVAYRKYDKWIAWLEKQGESKEKPTKRQVWDYCNKISHEWWQIAMDKWNTLTDEEKTKYNQFIGFNDFSDTLMNITAGALFQLIDTGKLEYEEGSLLLEKPDDTPKSLEVMTVPVKSQGKQESTCPSYNSVHNVKFPFPFKAKVKSNGKIVTIINGQLSMDCKEWIKYQSDVEDGYTVYAPEELVNIEQKPANKVEQKFKVKDWIINNDKRIAIPTQILKIEEYGYLTSKGYISFDKVQTDYHLWTIEDAKDGDVLYVNYNNGNKSIFIFNNIEYDSACCYYCYSITENRGLTFTSVAHIKADIYPATKEQRDLLFSKMKDAGYEWNTEKKELKKIEQKSVEWSEKDKHHIEVIENTLKKVYFEEENDPKLAAAFVWLNSLKPKSYQMPVPTLPEGGEK